MAFGVTDIQGQVFGSPLVRVYGANGKQKFPTGGGGVTSVTATSPITSSGGLTPVISTLMNTNRLIGRSTAGAGVMEEIIIGSGLTLSAGTLSATATGGGIPYGIASGTNTYTVTIPGVLNYTDGDTYVVKFTNGNDTDSTIDINGLGVKTLVKEFNVQITGGDIVSGQVLILIYDGTNFQCIGVAPNQLFAYVTNDDSVTITKGQPVYAFGAAGNRMSVKLASNASDATSAQTVGVVFSSSIAANQRGFIITQGVISGVNTAAYSPGDQLYLGATAGTLTNVKPYAPNHLVYVGIVERANAGNGQIYIKPQNGYELKEIHDVDLITTPPTNDQVLTYESLSGLWKNKSIPVSVSSVTATGPITSSGGTTPNISTSMATNRLIGRGSAGTGVMEEIALGSGLGLSGTTLNAGNVDLLEITATTSNAREDNYAPTGWPGVSANIAKVIRLSTTNTNNVTSLGGLASGTAGKIVTIVNASANGLIILENESASSTAANRFQFNQSSTYFLLPNRTLTLIYSGSRWVQFGLSPVSGFDQYDEMTTGQQTATTTHVSNLFNWVTSPSTATIRSEGAQNGELGVIGFLTGTSASISMRAAMGTRTDTAGFVRSGAASPVLYLAKIRIPTAPSVAQDFDVHVGFMNSTTTTLATGCYWWYLPTAASGNTTWQNITSTTTGGSVVTVNSPIAASTTSTLYLGLFFTGNNGDCIYIHSTDGVTYTVSSKFTWSSGTYEGKPFFGMAKTAGTTQRIFLIDSAGISYNIRR